MYLFIISACFLINRGAKMKKERKPRGIKLNGRESYDMCEHCVSYGCDPYSHNNPYFNDKKMNRSKGGVCISCGSKNCKCKSSLKVNKENRLRKEKEIRNVKYKKIIEKIKFKNINNAN